MVKLKQVIHRYCDETTIHGIRDLFYAKFVITKTFWALVIVCLATITVVQISNVIENFISEPTKTQITLLPDNVQPKYPPYIMQPIYFTDWLNYEQVERLNFDLETILYTASHFSFVYTKVQIDVERAKRKMERIMRRHKITTVNDLGMAISLPTLSGISNDSDNDIKLSRYLNIFGGLKYIGITDQSINNLTTEDAVSQRIKFESFSNFENTNIHKAFLKLFNHSLVEEFGLFKQYDPDMGNKAISENNLKSPLPINLNVASDKKTYSFVNVFLNSYEFYLKGNLYKWISRKDKACNETAESKFFEECEMECTYKHRILTSTVCVLLIFPQNYTAGEHNVENECKSTGTDEDAWKPNIYKECIDSCLSSCNKWNYQFSSVVSPNQIDSDNALKVNGQITLTYTEKENMLLISLTPSVTWENAVANIGGLLGLWLGGSVMSFIQIIYFLCWYPAEVWISDKWMDKRKKKSLQYIQQQSLMSSRRKSVAYNDQLGTNAIVSCTSCVNLQAEVFSLKNEIDEIKKQLVQMSIK